MKKLWNVCLAIPVIAAAISAGSFIADSLFYRVDAQSISQQNQAAAQASAQNISGNWVATISDMSSAVRVTARAARPRSR